jgi:hypothetical protein
MIDKSQGFFNDAPPPYQHALQSSSDSKVNLSHTPTPSQTSRSSHSNRLPKASRKAAAPSRWFPTSIFGLSKTAKQVRSVTQEFLRDLLSQARPSEHEWHSLLSNCADTCNAQGLSFSALLQEPFVEDHLPVYWAILKRPPAAAAAAVANNAKTDRGHTSPAGNSDPDALVLAILDASLPINAASVADARLACVTVSDNALFVRLGQRFGAFSPRSGTDSVLLGGSDTVDTVSVEEARGSGSNVSAAFTVRFSITQFQLRMRVSKQVRIEFIARGTFCSPMNCVGLWVILNITHVFFGGVVCVWTGRLWYLWFSVAVPNTGPPLGTSRAGEWLVSLGLAEPSSPTWVDARLCIVDRSPPPSPPSTLDPSSVAYRMTQRAGLPLPPKHPTSGKQRNAASLPIKTNSSQLSPGGPTREVVVSLDKFLFGATLQNE